MTVITSATIFEEVTVARVMRDSGYVVIVGHVMVSDSVCIRSVSCINREIFMVR